MNKELYPISNRLLILANDALSVKDKDLLAVIINQLFIDLNAGHSCTNLTKFIADAKLAKKSLDTIYAILLQSGLVASFSENSIPNKLQAKPITLLKLNNGVLLLFITKYLHYELSIAKQINLLTSFNANIPTEIPVFAKSLDKCLARLSELKNKQQLPNSEQLWAIENSVGQKLSIITGGPGTGKTTTAMFLLWMLYQLYDNSVKIKICAPTGKAAKRVQNSIVNNLKRYQELIPNSEMLEIFTANNDNFLTIHKLLGSRTNNIYFTHNQDNPLDLDILIVDESSMVSLPLFSKLLQAIDTQKIKHIIFLGDKNQLSSVEEGYVFATLVQNKILRPDAVNYDLFTPNAISVVSDLRLSNRNKGDVGRIANAVLEQDEKTLRNILANSATVKLFRPNVAELMRTLFANGDYLNYIKTLNLETDSVIKSNKALYDELFSVFNQQCVLCLTNVGMLGTNKINFLIEKRIKQELAVSDIWYTGRPIVILENDYALGLSNGDIGFCVIQQDKMVILFDNGKEFIPETLPKHQLAYAITIHKSQGSEYKHVNIVLVSDNALDKGQRLLSRELVYTAITRAHYTVTIFSDEDLLIKSLNIVTTRNTGLDYLIG